MKKKNGFFAMSIIYSFFIVFAMLSAILISNYAHNRLLIRNINDEIKEEINVRSESKLARLKNIVPNSDFEESVDDIYSTWSHNSGVVHTVSTDPTVPAFSGTRFVKILKTSENPEIKFPLSPTDVNSNHKYYFSSRINTYGLDIHAKTNICLKKDTGEIVKCIDKLYYETIEFYTVGNILNNKIYNMCSSMSRIPAISTKVVWDCGGGVQNTYNSLNAIIGSDMDLRNISVLSKDNKVASKIGTNFIDVNYKAASWATQGGYIDLTNINASGNLYLSIEFDRNAFSYPTGIEMHLYEDSIILTDITDGYKTYKETLNDDQHIRWLNSNLAYFKDSNIYKYTDYNPNYNPRLEYTATEVEEDECLEKMRKLAQDTENLYSEYQNGVIKTEAEYKQRLKELRDSSGITANCGINFDE